MNSPDRWIPYEISPSTAGVAPGADGVVEYLKATPDFDDLLIRERAVVFRDFRIDPTALDTVLDPLLANRLAYVHGNSPRTKVGRNVYTSTEYPQEFTISMHNELSYAHRWPARLCFFCERPAGTGGATPVVDGARWLESLSDEVRTAFADGVRYTQNLHGGQGFGKSWQDTFETDRREEVERFLAGTDAEWTWRRDGGIRITQTRPATTRHPVTGVEVWFNQADQWHPATVGDEDARALLDVLGPEEMPQSVTFADGSPIPDGQVLQVRDRGLANAVDVDWATGDLLLIDNVLVGHGRRPFTGQRRVLVAMSD